MTFLNLPFGTVLRQPMAPEERSARLPIPRRGETSGPRAVGDLPEPPDAPIYAMFAKAVELGSFPNKTAR